MAVLASLASLFLLPSLASIVFAVVLFGSGVTAAAFRLKCACPPAAARQRTQRPYHSSEEKPRAEAHPRLSANDDDDDDGNDDDDDDAAAAASAAQAESLARELQLYKDLYYKLQRLEDYPDVLPHARRVLISLLSQALADAQQQQQQQLRQHGGTSEDGGNDGSGGGGHGIATSHSGSHHTILSVPRYTPAALERFMHDEHVRIEQQWESYLAQRRLHPRRSKAMPSQSSSSSSPSPTSSAPPLLPPPPPAPAPVPEMFADRAEATWWLRQIAPVKFVDGAWLGHIHKISTPFALRRAATKDAWQVLSEELGDGDRQKHHVHVYEELLASLALPAAAAAATGPVARPKSHHQRHASATTGRVGRTDDDDNNNDDGSDGNAALPSPPPPPPPPLPPLPPGDTADFVHARHALDRVCVWRAAVAQLLVSLFPHDFLPEVLGFNLHFEGVTLETLAAARELREVGLDPYYFVLHVSIDNAHSGHTAMAIQTVVKYLEHVRRSNRSSRRRGGGGGRCGGCGRAGASGVAEGENGGDADADADADAAEAAVQLAWKRVQAGFILSAGLPTTPCAAVLREQPAIASAPASPAAGDPTAIVSTAAPITPAANSSALLPSPSPLLSSSSPSHPPAMSSSSSSRKHSFPRSVLEAEVVDIFRSKAAVSHKLHCSSRAKLGRRALADWLAPDAAAAPHWPRAFLDALASSPPWVRRGRAAQSRLVAELSWRGRMFGSFTQREVDAVSRWIDSLDANDNATSTAGAAGAADGVGSDGGEARAALAVVEPAASAVPSAPSVYATYVGRPDADAEPAWHARDIRADYPVLTPPPPHIAAILEDVVAQPDTNNNNSDSDEDGVDSEHNALRQYGGLAQKDEIPPLLPPLTPSSPTLLSPLYPPPPTTHGCGLALAPAVDTPDPAHLLPLWFAHPCLLECFVCVPARTTSPAACAVVRLLRAQAGFDVEGPGVAGMDEVRRTDAGGLVELGLEMAARLRCRDDGDGAGTARRARVDADAVANVGADGDDAIDSGDDVDTSTPESLKDVLDRWPSDFALAMLHASMRPVANAGLLLGLAWAFVGLHELLAADAEPAPAPPSPSAGPWSISTDSAPPLPPASLSSSSSLSLSTTSTLSSSMSFSSPPSPLHSSSTTPSLSAASSSSMSSSSSLASSRRSTSVFTAAELLSPASKAALRLIARRERESLRVCMDDLASPPRHNGSGGGSSSSGHGSMVGGDDRVRHWTAFCRGYALGRQHIERAFSSAQSDKSSSKQLKAPVP